MGRQAEADCPYRGPDRRRRNEGLLTSPSLARVLALTVVVTVGAWVPGLFLLARHPGAASLGAYGAIAAGLVYAVAGAFRLITWKVTGRSIFGWMGSAFVVLGVMVAVSDGLSTFGDSPAPATRPIDGVLVAALAGWLLWKGFVDDEVNAGLRPLTNLVWVLGGGLVAMGFFGVAQSNGVLPSWIVERPVAVGLNVASALIWVALSVVVGRAAGQGRPGIAPWAAYVIGILAAASAIRALSPLPWASTLTSSAWLFCAAALSLGTSIARVQEMLASEDRVQRRLQLTLSATVHQAARDRRALESWLHDLRNAVAGLQAADAVLRTTVRGGAEGDPELADAVTAELARLHAMVDPARQLRIGEVDLSATLGPIAAAERARGATIDVRLDASTVLADAAALSRVVQNLLTNARRYAPGSPVTVTAVPLGQLVEITVKDNGPGIPAAERATVFERGKRGAGSAGTDGRGLGLYVVRTLLTAMGGSVTVAPNRGPGCTMVLLLPAPTPVPVAITGLARSEAHSRPRARTGARPQERIGVRP